MNSAIQATPKHRMTTTSIGARDASELSHGGRVVSELSPGRASLLESASISHPER
jgi:hypothetical protein